MILNKIKLNYYQKLIDDHFSNNQFTHVKEILKNNKKNKLIFSNLLHYINDKYLNQHQYSNFYNQKILWIISYEQSDIDYVLRFLNQYFSKVECHNIYFSDYKKFIFDGLGSLAHPIDRQKILFEDLTENSNLYQTSALLNHEKQLCVLSTSSAFFETTSKKYFTSPFSTLGYLHIVKNPLQVYLKHKNQFQSSQQAINFINDADQDAYSNNFQNNILIPEIKKNWNINTYSWVDENVVSTFRGKTIKFEDLVDNPFEILLEVLFHIKQAGWDFDIDYDVIKNFIDENDHPTILEPNISKQELKLLSKCIEKKLLDKFDYQV